MAPEGSDRLRRWAGLTARFAAGAAWIGAYPAYGVGIGLFQQAGPPRAMGVAAVAVAGLFGATGLLAAGAIAAGLDRWPRLAGVARDAFVAAAAAGLGLLGLGVAYYTPSATPPGMRAAFLAFALALFVAYRRNPAPHRVLAARTLTALTAAVLAVPLLALPWVAWAAATDRLRLPTAVAPLEGPGRPGKPRRIVLLTFDGLRGDALDLVHAGGPTPAFARLAREADAFPAAIAGGDQTRVSMPVVLTGLPAPALFPFLPNAYGSFRRGGVTGLAGHLRGAGYRTVYTTSVLKPAYFGMEDEYDGGNGYAPPPPSLSFNVEGFLPLKETVLWLHRRFVLRIKDELALPRTEHLAIDLNEATMRNALAALRNDAPTFLWIHSFVPHFPYLEVPPERLGKPEDGRPYRVVTEVEAKAARTDPAARAELARVYATFVRYADDAYGRFERRLRAEGLWDDTLLVVTSDHGEAFGPRRFYHAEGHVAEATIRVPLLVKPPGRRAGDGRLRRDPAGQIDVVPTVVAAAYGRVPPGLPGRDLLAGPAPADRTLLAWAPPDDRVGRRYRRAAAYRGRWKLVRTDEGATRLFDLAADPAAATDVAAAHPDVVAALDGWLREAAPQTP